MTEEQAEEIPEVKEMIDDPPDWLEEWSRQVGAELKDGLREAPSWIAFARENGTVYHTYTVTAPDPFVAPFYSSLLERTPKPQPTEPRAWRKDESRTEPRGTAWRGLCTQSSSGRAGPDDLIVPVTFEPSNLPVIVRMSSGTAGLPTKVFRKGCCRGF